MPIEGLVEIGHVSGVMLAMVDFHGSGIDMGLQSIMGVWKFREFEGHVFPLRFRIMWH